MMDPQSGRWLAPDPGGFDADPANLYRYCGNDPVNKTDPSGLDEIALPGPFDKQLKDYTATLTNNKIPFGTGTATISADVVTYTVGGRPQKYARFKVTADQSKQRDVDDMKDTHWVQFVKVDRYEDKAGKMLSDKGLSPSFVYSYSPLKGEPGGVSVIMMQTNPLMAATLTASKAFYSQRLVFSKLGEWALDSAAESVYTEIGGVHERTATSLTYADGPSYPVEGNYPMAVQTFALYLVVNGQVAYEVDWSATTTFNGAGQAPTIDYVITGGSKPKQLPAYLTGKTLYRGYATVHLPKSGKFEEVKYDDLVEYINPVTGISK